MFISSYLLLGGVLGYCALSTYGLLMIHGFDEEPEDPQEEFFKACALGDNEKVKELLQLTDESDLGVININERDDRGFTPLLLASYNGRISVVKTLLSTVDVNGNYLADPNKCTLSGKYPIELATDLKHYNIVKILLSYEVEGEELCLIKAGEMHDRELVDILDFPEEHRKIHLEDKFIVPNRATRDEFLQEQENNLCYLYQEAYTSSELNKTIITHEPNTFYHRQDLDTDPEELCNYQVAGMLEPILLTEAILGDSA
jgi:ankyrin repeat protein